MDAKLSPNQGLSISGIGLASVLAAAMTCATLVVDGLGNRVFWQPNSLTMPFLLSALGSAVAGLWVVPLLQALKTGQIIREDGPKAHLKKAGTPTMGGVFFIPVALLVACVLSNFAQDVLAVSALTLAYGLIGRIDDWQILLRKSNKGISPKTKLILQIVFAIGFCLWMILKGDFTITNIVLPWVGLS